MNDDQVKGKAKHAEGTVQETWGDAKETSGDAIDDARDKSGDAWDAMKEKASQALGAAKAKVGEHEDREKQTDDPETPGSGGDVA